MMLTSFFCHFCCCLYFVFGSDFNDKLLYDISWNGPLSEQTAVKHTTLEKILITTKDNEKYQCLIPPTKDAAEDYNVDHGTSPEVLLTDVIDASPKKCSYRMEPYWTYEVCHGKSVIQFHEERLKDGEIKKDEFVLGKMTDEEVKELLYTTKPIDKPDAGEKKVPKKKIEGQDMPYFSVEMPNGTPCDINEQPRKTNVLYVCHLSANNEVISVKEVTTCEYEIIVLSAVLCENPAYTVKKETVNDIQCHALPGHPSHPNSLVAHLNEDSLFRTSSTPRNSREQKKAPLPKDTKPYNDMALNKQFLNGDYCLVGGAGWWSYEFCNGKFVHQFHLQPNKAKTIIKLGYWDKEKHLNMVKSHAVVPKGKNHVMHYYSGGDICDLTGKPRTALVVLTCLQGKGQQLSIYMTEPQPCEYTIGVESPILCPFVKGADENGLFEHMKK